MQNQSQITKNTGISDLYQCKNIPPSHLLPQVCGVLSLELLSLGVPCQPASLKEETLQCVHKDEISSLWLTECIDLSASLGIP